MATTTTLRPTLIRVGGTPTGVTVVGGPLAVSDDDDSTYVENLRNEDHLSGTVVADFGATGAFPEPGVGSTVTSVAIRARVLGIGAAVQSAITSNIFQHFDSSYSSTGIQWVSDVPYTTGRVSSDDPGTYLSGDLTGLASLLWSGNISLQFLAGWRLPENSPASYGWHLFELQIDVTWTPIGDEPPPIAGCGHPTRSIPGPTHGDPAFPGAVTIPSTIVGGDLALSDDSDATYADHAPYDGWSAQTRAFFPGYESTVERKFKLQFRAQRFDAGDNENGVSVFLANQASTDGWLSVSYYAPDMSPTPAWLVTAEATIPAGAPTSDGLMVGINVFRTDGGGGDPVLRVFDLELCWSQAEAPPIVVAARVTPSLRMLQRGGSGGMSGIPRMVGDPTRRGIRQGPGSIY